MKKITGKCHKYKEYDASPTSKRNLLFNGQLNKLNLVKFKITNVSSENFHFLEIFLLSFELHKK